MQNEICPNCDSVLPVGALQCPGCGRRVSFTAVPYDSGEYSRFHFLRKLGPVGKVIIVIAVAAVPTLLVFLGYNYFWTAAIESNPYPTTPQAAVQQFFSSLQQEANSDFQGCYNLIHSKHKSQAAVVKSNRTDFIDHFRRIRDYLIEYIGPDFLAKMKFVEGSTSQVTFDDFITLTLVITPVKGIEDENHYAIQDIREFPFPSPLRDSMGITRRDNQMNDLMDDIDNMGHARSKQPWDILIRKYKNEKQLDVRHEMLLTLIYTFGDKSSVRNFLRVWIPREESAPHLRLIAQQFLESNQ